MTRKEELAKRNLYDELVELRDTQRREIAAGVLTVKGDELPWEVNRQGVMRWYQHPMLHDVASRTLMISVVEIPPGSRTGRQKIQGDQMLYVWEGQGYTELNGMRHDWEKDDVIAIPPLPEGNVVQHFNASGDRHVLLICAQPNWADMIGVDMGCGFEQLEDAPEYESRG